METKITTLPQLSFAEAVKLNFARITDFRGRSRRSELWWNYLMYVILTFCLSLLLGNGNLILLAIISLILQLAIVPVTIRRMHDRGHSGIWLYVGIDNSRSSYTRRNNGSCFFSYIYRAYNSKWYCSAYYLYLCCYGGRQGREQIWRFNKIYR